MPELRLREVRFPELHLPEMSREDISRALGDARRDLDLTRFDPRQMDLPEFEMPKVDVPKVDVPKIDITKLDLSKVDLAKAMTTAAQAAGIVRAARRPRLPFVIGGLVAVALIGAAVVSSPVVRPRLVEFGRRARERAEAWRAARLEAAAAREAEEAALTAPHAFDAAVAVPIEPSAFSDSAPAEGSPFDGPSELPEGLGVQHTSSPETTPAR